MAIKLVIPPSSEPVSLAELKAWLRVDGDDENDLITSLGKAAREKCEAFCRRAFINQTWRSTRDEFPSANGGLILIPRPPTVSISSFTYVDQNGVTQTLDAADYQLDLDDAPARLMPAYGTTWPATRAGLGVVKLTYVAGYGAAADVPEAAKAAIKHAVAGWFDNRAAFSTGTIVAELPQVSLALLQTADLRVFRFDEI